jgi:hypothetical protein
MKYILLLLPILLASCYHAERNCKDFKTGTFRAEIIIDGVKHETVSTRTENLVIETYQGKTDTASIRWINDCEYVLQQLHPKNMQQRKAVDIKILTTSKNSYTFEFGVVGDDFKLRGKAERINNE